MKRRVLHAGPLRFTALEAGQGPVVLLLHGFPDHQRSWRYQLPALAEAGYHALAPNLRGYETSSQPSDGDYRVTSLVGDVDAWIDALGCQKVHLIGHDWGAVIAMAAASHLPEKVASLMTVAVPPLHRIPAMIRHKPSALTKLWYMLLFQLRGRAERLLLARDGLLIRRLWRDWSPGWRCPEAEMRAVLSSLASPGVAEAALSYYRHLPDLLSHAGRQSWAMMRGPIAAPTFALTGARDGCMDSALYEVAISQRHFSAGISVERLPNAGHFPHQEHPEVFNRMLLSWLSEQG